MAITKAEVEERANKWGWIGTVLHYVGDGPCRRQVGPRGGVTEHTARVRVSGAAKFWKRSPERFSFPVKYGLYASHYVDENNADKFHWADECPLVVEE